jgi:hypothetical protein
MLMGMSAHMEVRSCTWFSNGKLLECSRGRWNVEGLHTVDCTACWRSADFHGIGNRSRHSSSGRWGWRWSWRCRCACRGRTEVQLDAGVRSTGERVPIIIEVIVETVTLLAWKTSSLGAGGVGRVQENAVWIERAIVYGAVNIWTIVPDKSSCQSILKLSDRIASVQWVPEGKLEGYASSSEAVVLLRVLATCWDGCGRLRIPLSIHSPQAHRKCAVVEDGGTASSGNCRDTSSNSCERLEISHICFVVFVWRNSDFLQFKTSVKDIGRALIVVVVVRNERTLSEL